MKWLDHLSNKTIEWVTSAIKADNFETNATEEDLENGNMPPSSSVTDLFTVVFQQMEIVLDLGWRNEVQNACFLQKFAKVRKII